MIAWPDPPFNPLFAYIATCFDVQCKLDVASDNQLYDIASCTAHALLAATTVSGEEAT